MTYGDWFAEVRRIFALLKREAPVQDRGDEEWIAYYNDDEYTPAEAVTVSLGISLC